MTKQHVNNIRLGIFVIAGFFLLIFSLYVIGKNANLFGARFELRTRVNNANGLLRGNNVHFSGIQAGTVKSIVIINDTTIEIRMLLDIKLRPYIADNALVSIGTEGLMGNKIINITPRRERGALVKEGDLLPAQRTIDTGEMLETLYKTNNTVSEIAGALQTTIRQVNQSAGLWNLLNDKQLALNLRTASAHLSNAADGTQKIAGDLYAIVHDAKNGKGAIGALLTDTLLVANLDEAVLQVKIAGNNVALLTGQLNEVTQQVQRQLNSGNGMGHALLHDSTLVIKLQASLDNIQKGTDGFNQNMEALKHNFLFRGYFRKLEKQNNDR